MRICLRRVPLETRELARNKRDDTIVTASVSPEFLLLIGRGAGKIGRGSGVQFNPGVVEPLASVAEQPRSLFPEEHCLDLREHLGSSFRLAHLKHI
jgi:hypothetical protein